MGEITGTIIASLCMAWFISTMFREHFKNKWYKRGYIEAASKYDKEDSEYDFNSISYGDEADKKFNKEYGFHYD